MKPRFPIPFTISAGACAAALLAAGTIHLALGGSITHKIKIQRAVVPIYAGDQSAPCALLRAERIYTDYERKGFFRIGVLPMAIIEGLTLEIRQAHQFVQAMAEMNRILSADGTRRVEIRQFKLKPASSEKSVLTAERARFRARGEYLDLEGARWTSHSNELAAGVTTLGLRGGTAGRLVWGSSPPQIIQLLPLSSSTQN